MASVKAAVNPIVVDNEVGQTNGSTTISYEKKEHEELWEKMPGGSWALVNVHIRTGRGDEAEWDGSFPVTLNPGQIYEAGVYNPLNNPLRDPIPLASLKLFCMWKKPEDRKLITDQNSSTGGTWHWHQVATKVETNIIAIGASRFAPTLDSNDIPQLQSPDGAPATPLTYTTDHRIELRPLLPGNQYFFVVVVTDKFGNWDVLQEEFTTLRRKLTVEFPTLHIYNDGDPAGYGQGEFWFRVYFGEARRPRIIQDFHWPTQDIDDWSETDRPYPLGFAHIGSPQVVQPGEEIVLVGSWGKEHDGILEPDEGASSRDILLPLPTGRFVEKVTNSTFLLDCGKTTTGDDFHYGVEVRWSVDYLL